LEHNIFSVNQYDHGCIATKDNKYYNQKQQQYNQVEIEVEQKELEEDHAQPKLSSPKAFSPFRFNL